MKGSKIHALQDVMSTKVWSLTNCEVSSCFQMSVSNGTPFIFCSHFSRTS